MNEEGYPAQEKKQPAGEGKPGVRDLLRAKWRKLIILFLLQSRVRCSESIIAFVGRRSWVSSVKFQ